MRKLFITGVAAVALGVPVTAHASGANYAGGCRVTTLNDITAGGGLGGNQWTGEVDATVVATNRVVATISVSCHLKINGADHGVVVAASSVQVATGAAEVTYSAGPSDVVELCDDVTINGVAQPEDCHAATVTQTIPQPVIDLIGAFGGITHASSHASGTSYTGGCNFWAHSDTTPGGQLGGPEQWTGEVDATVVATVPGATVAVSCRLVINGADNGIVLIADKLGIQTATGAGEITYSAAAGFVVEICADVTINGEGQAEDCGTATDVVAASDAPAPTCPVLSSLAGSYLNGFVTVDSTGDTYVGGTTDDDKIWDCP